MLRLSLLLILFHSFSYGNSDSSFFCNANQKNNSRTYLVSGSLASASAVSFYGLSAVWYKDDRQPFTFFNDNHEWKQMDKIGHFTTANNLTLITSGFFQWSGISKRKSAFLGAGYALVYTSTIEIFDGFGKGYGFSVMDVVANVAGASTAVGKEFSDVMCFPVFKFSAHTTSLAHLNPSLLGGTVPERLLKDYNGQTYWISIPSLIKKMPWFCVSVGYGASDMVRARDEQNQALGYNPYRRYLLSADIDLSKVKTRSCFLKGVFSAFRFIKMPFPAVEYSKSRILFHPFYF